MKTIKTLGITSLLILLFAGCGEEQNNSVFGSSSTDAVISMQTGQTSEVLDGDVLEPSTANTRIKVEHIIDDDTKYVTVVSGSATLLRGTYALK